MRRRWEMWVLAALIVTTPGLAWSIPVLTFTGSPTGGTLEYDGQDGVDPLEGHGILFTSVTGAGTPSNSGATLYCDPTCGLDFETGPNISETPYTWAGGGTFTLTGDLYTLPGGVGGGGSLTASGTLVDGSWFNNVGGAPLGPGFSASGQGFDVKDPDLLTFFGITHPNFTFVNFEVGGPFSPAGDGSFVVPVTTVFLENTAAPEPGTLFLLGAGLSGLGILTRRRFSRVGRG